MKSRGKGSKAKGGSFERKICKLLSLWVTGGKRIDCFWRSAMSGGRATVSKDQVRQAGDICGVAPESHALTDWFYIECKHLKNIGFVNFVLRGVGPLAKIWLKTVHEAKKYDRQPMLIVRQNSMPILVITKPWAIAGSFKSFVKDDRKAKWLVAVEQEPFRCDIRLLDDVLKLPFPKEVKHGKEGRKETNKGRAQG